jgi:hypothetical protein
LGKALSPIGRRLDDGEIDDANDDDNENIDDIDVDGENDGSSPLLPPTTRPLAPTRTPRCRSWNDDTPLDGDSSSSGNSNVVRGSLASAGRTNAAVEDLNLSAWFMATATATATSDCGTCVSKFSACGDDKYILKQLAT